MIGKNKERIVITLRKDTVQAIKDLQVVMPWKKTKSALIEETIWRFWSAYRNER